MSALFELAEEYLEAHERMEAAGFDYQTIDDMQSRADANVRKAQGMRKYLMDAMVAAGVRKVACPFFVVSVRETPASVIIDDALAIPARFLVQPEAPPPRPDKRAIAEAIKSEPVPWAHLQKSVRLDIR